MPCQHGLIPIRLFGSRLLHGKSLNLFSTRARLSKTAAADSQSSIHSNHQPRTSRQNTLRKVAIEAERTTLRHEDAIGKDQRSRTQSLVKKVTAYCAAEHYDMALASRLLLQEGYQVDPMKTGLYPQVLHIRLPKHVSVADQTGTTHRSNDSADIMVFPSGTIVAWNVADQVALRIMEQVLVPAVLNVHYEAAEIEQEDMEFVEDASRARSEIAGELIIIGTSGESTNPTQSQNHKSLSSSIPGSTNDVQSSNTAERNAILAKIAFASGIARSTKLAMLERSTEAYIASTRSIPLIMARGWPRPGQQPRLLGKVFHIFSLTSRLPFSRPFILQKTGELLSIRAQLNLYGELTDSLPDLFWDSKHDLWLENYYDMVGRALDIGVRIKILNQKMDYAQEIATTLRETLNERHNLRLEWGIIVLIAIEVLFEIDQRWRRTD